MEAKLVLRRQRETFRKGVSPFRCSVNFPAVRERIQLKAKQAYAFVLDFLKTRDPLINFFLIPNNKEPGNETDGSTKIFIAGRFAAVIPGNSTAEYVIANGFLNFLNLYNFALVGRLLLTWFPSRPIALERPLGTICDPYLNLFRGIIPPIGGIDFSPILAFIVLNVFTNAAAAIPAELPRDNEKPRRRGD